MLSYFRINDPYRLIILLVLLVIIGLPFLISLPMVTLEELKGMVAGEEIRDKVLYVQFVDSTAPMTAMVDVFLEMLFGRSLLGRHILALVVLFFQASYFGILLINNRAYNENSYVPALIFGLLCFFSFDLMAITPDLLASTMLLLALNNLFKEIEFRVDRDSIVLNLGVFIGIASLFVLSYTIFLVASIFILIIFARTSLRKISLILFGYGLVHAILITWYYCYENTEELWQHFYQANWSATGNSLVNINSLMVLLAVPALYFIFSLFMLTREARFTKYQSQLFQTIFLWLGFGMVQVWLAPNRSPHSLFACLPPVAYFISHYLLLIKRRRIAEGMLWLFIAGLISVNVLAWSGKIDLVNYKELYAPASPTESGIRNKKVMVLGQNVAWYRDNRQAGYFFDWELSKKYFDHPDQYESIIRISESFLSDPPDVIVDEQGKMEMIMDRIPQLRVDYVREGGVYRRR